MQRHFAGAYVVAAIDLLAGGPLAIFVLLFSPQLFRQPNVHLDDYLAFAAMAVTGTVSVGAAIVTLLHRSVSYGVLRKARISAVVSDLYMLVTGVAMWIIARQRGGDWAGLGLLGALLFIAVGTSLLLLSLLMLRYMRRMRPVSTATL
ncbi:MAG TPA: hypothetical protein VKV95_06610 [Terriglobia bacterium]|nr:hypothetical protein [Terriglobia bacterium]